MEQLFFLLIVLFASSSKISAGNDTNIKTTLPPNTTMSQLSVEGQTTETVTYTSSSQYENGVTNLTLKTVITTTAPVSFNYTGVTDGSNLSWHTTSVGAIRMRVQTAEKNIKIIHNEQVVSSQERNAQSRAIYEFKNSSQQIQYIEGRLVGHSNFTNFTLTTPKSYTTTLNSTSSPAAKITDSTDGSNLMHNTSVGVSVLPKTSTTANSNINMSEETATPSQAPDTGLTLLAFGVMSLILILIVVMVILVTAINLRGRCRKTKQHESIKNCDSVISDSNMTSNFEKESITLVSVRTINTENNTDSPQMSSVRSTIVDYDDQEFTRDLLGIKDGQ